MCSDVAEVSLDLLTADVCARLADGESAQISNALSFSCAHTSAEAYSEMPRLLNAISRCVFILELSSARRHRSVRGDEQLNVAGAKYKPSTLPQLRI